MKKPTNKVKILKTLLESPKTTGDVAIALGYKDDKGYGIYKNVRSDLKTLNQNRFIHIIESNKKTVGAPGTTYDINYDLSDWREFLKKYPSLIPDLQNNDKIRDMLLDQHPELCINELPPKEREILKKIGYNSLEMWEESILSGKEEFEKYLKTSPAFFKICLLNDTKYILENVSKMYHEFAPEYIFDDERLKTIYENNTPQLRARNILHKFCNIKEAL